MDCNMSHYMQPNTGHTEGHLMVTVNTILLDLYFTWMDIFNNTVNME